MFVTVIEYVLPDRMLQPWNVILGTVETSPNAHMVCQTGSRTVTLCTHFKNLPKLWNCMRIQNAAFDKEHTTWMDKKLQDGKRNTFLMFTSVSVDFTYRGYNSSSI
jgi:hypothetical protein